MNLAKGSETMLSSGSMLDACCSFLPQVVLALIIETGLDFYGCVKLINYVRAEVREWASSSSGDRSAAAADIKTAAISSQGRAFADERCKGRRRKKLMQMRL